MCNQDTVYLKLIINKIKIKKEKNTAEWAVARVMFWGETLSPPFLIQSRAGSVFVVQVMN